MRPTGIKTAARVLMLLVASTLAACSASSPSPSTSGTATPSGAQLTQACSQAAGQSSPERLTLSVAHTLSGKQVVVCEVGGKGSAAALHTAPVSVTSEASWAANATPGEALGQGCKETSTPSLYVYDGTTFLLARNFVCTAGDSSSQS
jgi:hypothetical protein